MSTKRKAAWIAPSFDDFGTEEITRKSNKGQKTNHLKKEIGVGEESSTSWVDKYKPKTEDELAVHKKKLQEIKSWLKQHLLQTQINRVGILLLTGPSGCGKTACVHALRKELGYDLVEWINPLIQEFDKDNLRDITARQESQSQLFHDFLLRANRYQQLQVDNDSNTTHNDGDKRVILIEDMPNFLLFDPTKMPAILRQYKQKGRSTLIFIMSDSNTDNFIHSLFPKKLQNEIDITNISLNPISQTSLIKTMTKIASSEAEQFSSLIVPTKDILDMLATSSNGDIRACINSLQFYCTDKNTVVQKSAKTKSKKTSRKKLEKAGTVDDIVGCIGCKDTSLFLFRALGKILYCKRQTEFSKEEDSLPLHLKKEKRKKLFENPEDVFGHTQVTSEKFFMYLHQNYVEFFASIDDVATAASYCVDGDVMSGIWDNRHTMNDYTASLSMRGIMFSNTRPSSAGGPGGGWRPLHKPHWFDAFKSLNQRTKSGREFVKGCRSTNTTLFTELLPYLNIISPNNPLISDISSFPLNKHQHIRQSMKVLNNANYEDNSEALDPLENYVSMTTNNDNENMVQQFDELDDVIEDFDDD